MTMKTPEQWNDETDEHTLIYSDRFMAFISAIQADARAELLEQNRRMREILKDSEHDVQQRKHEICLPLCPACRWESLKKEAGI